MYSTYGSHLKISATHITNVLSLVYESECVLKQLLLQPCPQLLPNWSAIKLLSVYGSIIRVASGCLYTCRPLTWCGIGL